MALAPAGFSADFTWTGATGDWDDAANWSPSGPPGISDTAIIGAVDTAVTAIDLGQAAYSLEGLSFQSGGYDLIEAAGGTTITVTGGTVHSQDDDFSFNGIFATLSLTAPASTISVQGMDHELDLDDVTASGDLTTDVEGFLCLGGATTVTGAFVKTGIGETCTMGMTASSATVKDGLFTVENDSNLGSVSIETVGMMVIDYGATVTATSVETSGFLVLSAIYADMGTFEATNGVTVKQDGVLIGGGNIIGDVIVEAGGDLEAGAILDPELPLKIVGDLSLQTDSIMRIDIVDSTTMLGLVSVDGDINLAGSLCVCNSGEIGLYTLLEYTGTLTGTFAGIINALPEFDYEIIYNDLDNTVQLSITAVPEPSTAALAALSGMIVFARRRRV